MMRDLLENGRLAWRLLNDPRVATWIKVAIPLFVLFYLVSPIDIIPDFLLGAGQLDDLGVVLLGMSLIVRFSPQDVVAEHRSALSHGPWSDSPPQDTAGPGPATAQPSQGAPTTPIAEHRNGEKTVEGEYRVIPRD